MRANNLIGEEACRALVKLIRESDAELAEERAEGRRSDEPAVENGE